MENKKFAVAYIRVSTDKQANDEKFGIDVQKTAISKYAEDNGYEIVDWKIDVISGAKDDRPEFDKILYGGLCNPPIEAVIVYKNDRVARDTKLYFYYFYTLEKKGIKLISIEEHFGEDDPFANIYRSLLQFVAEQERRNITMRTSGGRNAKAIEGKYAGGKVPYGYRLISKQLMINPDEVEIVKKVFEMLSNGEPMLTISNTLNVSGYKTRKGTFFTNSSVKSIVSNMYVYKGYYKYGKSMEYYVKGEHPAILPADYQIPDKWAELVGKILPVG